MAAEEPALWEAIVTLILVGIMFVVLAIDKLPPDFVMFFTVVLLIPTGIISLRESLAVRAGVFSVARSACAHARRVRMPGLCQ